MKSIAFGLPVAKGKGADDVKAFIQELVNDRHDHFHGSRKDRALERIKVFHQTWPVEQFIVYMEAKDLAAAMRDNDPEHHFEPWFAKRYEELTGVHPDKVTHEIAELVMDWHPEKGAKTAHH